MQRLLSILLFVSTLVSLATSPVFSLSTSPSTVRDLGTLKPSFLRSPSTSSSLDPIDLTAVPAWNTSSWFGAAYTPSPAGNQLWWYEYSRYEPIVKRELAAAARIYGFTALRTFIHNMVYDAAPTQFLDNIERYLTLCHSLGIKPGFVFFDDCWDNAGATIPDSCVPVKGRHNGCWKTSPQQVQRTSVDRFRSYVTDIVTRFKDDPRVLYWEIFNEPNSSPFSSQLRDAAYGWATAPKPIQPVISCWGDNPDTQIVDEHRYDENFIGWTNDVYANVTKGGVVTEGGSRWFQGFDSDAGSVKTVMTWLSALRAAFYRGEKPFYPGMIISWEVNVGNSHTRWHWSTPDNSPEPTIGWDAHLHVDQTPISYTEAGLIQSYTKGTTPFYTVNTYMPDAYNNTRDYYLTVPTGAPVQVSATATDDGIYEVSFWPNKTSAFSLYTHMGGAMDTSYEFRVDLASALLSVFRRYPGNDTVLATWSYSTMECGVVSNGWNILRMIAVGGELDVYLNPMYTDAALPDGIQPRVSVVDPMPLKAGTASVQSMVGGARVDYFSVSKLEAYGEYVKLPGMKRKIGLPATE